MDAGVLVPAGKRFLLVRPRGWENSAGLRPGEEGFHPRVDGNPPSLIPPNLPGKKPPLPPLQRDKRLNNRLSRIR